MHATPDDLSAPPGGGIDNPYRPPAGRLGVLPAGAVSAASLALRLVILVFCSIQYVGLTHQLASNWELLSEPLRDGRIPLLHFAAAYAEALVLMLAGVFLLFRRRPAIWLFATNLLWQLYMLAGAVFNAAAGESPFASLRLWVAIASVACIAGLLWYAVSLRRRGLMR